MSDSGTLTVYQRMPDQLEAVKVLGTAIAKSGMFGCGSIEGGMVFAAECMFRNMPPLAMAQQYHVIFGKLSMKAEAMLAGFEREGGTYRVLSRTPELVSIEFTPPGGKPEVLSLSWEDAQKEPFVYEGKEEAIVEQLLAGKNPKLKPKYATPRSRMQMLWARLVSDSVRFLCPKVVCGVYTPEESEDIHEANGHAVQKSVSVVDQAEASEVATTEKPADAQLEFATTEQREAINVLVAQLGMTADQLNAALAKRNATSTRNLTRAAAQDLIDKLQAKLDQVKAAADAGLPKLEPGNDPITAACGPCTDKQEQAIKAALAEWKQIDPAAFNLAMSAFKQKLIESGREKIRDLSANDAARLYDCIKTRTLGSFLQRSLEQWKPKNGRARMVGDYQPVEGEIVASGR